MAVRRAAEAEDDARIAELQEAHAVKVEKARLAAIEREQQLREEHVQQKNDDSLRALFPEILEAEDKALEKALIERAFLPPIKPKAHQVDCILVLEHLFQKFQELRGRNLVDQLLESVGSSPLKVPLA